MERLKKELKRSAKRGYGLDNEEFSIGIGCMAAPVFDSEGQCAGAVGVTGYIEEYRDKDHFNYIKECLFQAAGEITEKLSLY